MGKCKGLEKELGGLRVEKNQAMAEVASRSKTEMDMSTDRR